MTNFSTGFLLGMASHSDHAATNTQFDEISIIILAAVVLWVMLVVYVVTSKKTGRKKGAK